MAFLLSSCVLWISTCISFLSADPIISVSARLNSTVLLPCNFTRDLSQTPLIRWSIGSEIVFERRGKEFYQGEGYEGRVDVPEDELLKGNCSLELKNFRVTDANNYISYRVEKSTVGSDKWDIVQNVELKVDDTPMPTKETIRLFSTIPPTTNGAGSNSPNTLIIISSVVGCVFIALLAIAVILYRRRKTNQPSNQIEMNSKVEDEHQVFVDTGSHEVL